METTITKVQIIMISITAVELVIITAIKIFVVIVMIMFASAAERIYLSTVITTVKQNY